jgi:hypothetical protein
MNEESQIEEWTKVAIDEIDVIVFWETVFVIVLNPSSLKVSSN